MRQRHVTHVSTLYGKYCSRDNNNIYLYRYLLQVHIWSLSTSINHVHIVLYNTYLYIYSILNILDVVDAYIALRLMGIAYIKMYKIKLYLRKVKWSSDFFLYIIQAQWVMHIIIYSTYRFRAEVEVFILYIYIIHIFTRCIRTNADDYIIEDSYLLYEEKDILFLLSSNFFKNPSLSIAKTRVGNTWDILYILTDTYEYILY